jgi:hypothetical protein
MTQFIWIKESLIFCPNNNHDWMHYFSAPTTSMELDDQIRTFFTTRGIATTDGNYQSRIGFVDLQIQNPNAIIRISNSPVLELGKPGTFDEHGTMVADVFKWNDKYMMYYMGWQRSQTVPYVIRLGLAISDDGEHFKKVSDGPVMGLTTDCPFGIGNVSVLAYGDKLRMWLTRYTEWLPVKNGYRPNYCLSLAESTNGIDWKIAADDLIPARKNESLATPCVRKAGGTYHMWFSTRPGVDEHGDSGKYALGYAQSQDGLVWTRDDNQAGITPSPNGWDSEMVCYPDVLMTPHGDYLFYNGNGYGKTGFGYARNCADRKTTEPRSVQY